MPTKTKTYAEKLRDPRWQKMRLEIMERDAFTCAHCGDKQNTLNVHHYWYERGKMPWDYPPDALATVCEPCHKMAEIRRACILKNCASGEALLSAVRLTGALKGDCPYGPEGRDLVLACEELLMSGMGGWMHEETSFEQPVADIHAAVTRIIAIIGKMIPTATAAAISRADENRKDLENEN